MPESEASLGVSEGITLRPGAVDKITSLLTERQLPEHGLRVFVAGGGCSGLQYRMAFEAQPGPMDNVFEAGGVRVFVDPTSLMHLAGSTVDYVDNLMGGGFKIDNPKAVASCGCGHSFRTGGSDENTSGGCS
ncbi:MAG: iron-sulfur cluster assembly accessory protein [bacterium]|nr:iron-sulfur cluster assembly accessory protein [bacterium]